MMGRRLFRVFPAVLRGSGPLLTPLFAGALLLAGCAAPSWRQPAAILATPGDTAVISRARTTLTEAFPPAYEATQRVILTVKGKQYAYNAWLKAEADGSRRLVLYGPLGLMTELRMRPDAAVEVVRMTPLFRESWVREFVARDLRSLFSLPEAASWLGTGTDGGVILGQTDPADGSLRRFQLDAADGHWKSVEWVSGEKCLWRAEILNWKSFPGFAAPIPAEFSLQSLHYSLHLVTTTCRPPQDPKRPDPL